MSYKGIPDLTGLVFMREVETDGGGVREEFLKIISPEEAGLRMVSGKHDSYFVEDLEQDRHGDGPYYKLASAEHVLGMLDSENEEYEPARGIYIRYTLIGTEEHYRDLTKGI